MPELIIARLATDVIMGQQVYEHEIGERAADALGADWTVVYKPVASLRSPLPAAVRLPMGLMTSSPAARRTAGRYLARGADVVQRMDLRIPPLGAREVLMVHDVAPWRFPDEGAPPKSVYAEVRGAARVICPSQFSADEVARTFGIATPTVIHNGVDPRFVDARPASPERLAELGLSGPFVLHAGGCSLRKNLASLAAAWPLVHARHPSATLALAGPANPIRDRHFAGVADIRLLGRLPFDDLTGVMAAAAGVVVPSVYEGFGIPALEAMAAGVPVVAADRSSLPEVCAGAALLVEPTPEGLAEGLIAALDGGPDVTELVRRGRARAAGFTWDASARAHAEVWRSVASDAGPRVHSSR